MNYYLLGYKQGCGSAFLFFGSWICFFLNADPDPAAFLMRIRILFFPPRSRSRRENGCRSGSTALVTKRLNLFEKNNHSQRQRIKKICWPSDVRPYPCYERRTVEGRWGPAESWPSSCPPHSRQPSPGSGAPPPTAQPINLLFVIAFPRTRQYCDSPCDKMLHISQEK